MNETLKRRGVSPAKRRRFLFNLAVVLIIALIFGVAWRVLHDHNKLKNKPVAVSSNISDLMEVKTLSDVKSEEKQIHRVVTDGLLSKAVFPPKNHEVSKKKETSEKLVEKSVKKPPKAVKVVKVVKVKKQPKKVPVLKAVTLKKRHHRPKPKSHFFARASASASAVSYSFVIGGGKALMKGLKNPKELASIVERSLKADSKGNTHLDENACKRYGSCATAYSYFYGIRTTHPDVALYSLSELPAYLRTLVVHNAPKGDWYMSRILVRRNGSYVKRTYDARGWSRKFHKGEKVWDDPTTKEHILAGDCGNVVAGMYTRNVVVVKKRTQTETGDCVTIHFITKPGDTAVKIAILGPAGNIVNDKCTAIDGHSWVNDICKENAPVICDFSKHEKVTGKPLQLLGSFYPKPGEHTLRLPGYFASKAKGYVTALILVRGEVKWPLYPKERPGNTVAFRAAYHYGEQRAEWIANNSDAMGVRWFDYQHNSARIWYSKSDVPKDVAQLYWPWGEWRGI